MGVGAGLGRELSNLKRQSSSTEGPEGEREEARENSLQGVERENAVRMCDTSQLTQS